MTETRKSDPPPKPPEMALFSAVFHQNRLAASLTRISDGFIVEANDAWLAITGFSRVEVKGKTTVELGVWGNVTARRAALTLVRDDLNSHSLDSALTTKTGEQRAVRVNLTKFLLDGVPHLLAFIDDLKAQDNPLEELEKARTELARQAGALKLALDTMSHGIVAMDADANITLYNQRFVELLDLPPALMTDNASGSDLAKLQRERGDFGPGDVLLEPHARPFVNALDVRLAPERYLRETLSGLTLEIKSRNLPGGGVVRTYEDVTHFVDAQAALRESEQRFRSLTALSSDWFWEQDESFRFVRVEGNSFDDYNTPASAYIGLTHWEGAESGVSDEHWAEHKRVLRSHQTFRNFEMQQSTRTGTMRWVSLSGAPIFDAQGEFRGYRGIGRDITDQKRSQDESQRMAFYDTLTGLPNRRLLMERLSQALVSSARNHSHGAMLFIDLDNFKDINDTLGHDVGDVLLENVANRLVTCIRQGDTVARFGGDEFVIMLEGLKPKLPDAIAQVRTVGEKILAAMNLPFDLNLKEHFSTPSIGVTLFSGHQHTGDELLKRADMAMYQAKAAGRNTMRFFDPDMQAAVAQRSALELDLRKALERSELVLYYQAVVNRSGDVTGVEALVRWRHPQRGLVNPIDFVPVAEQTGLILVLGQWVLKTACRQLLAWAGNALTKDLTVSVNISTREFRQVEFVTQILDALISTGANPNRLLLEITESMLLTDVEDAIQKMALLKKAGVRFALDDFGTGFSSLAYLKRLPLDRLKIDKSFVRDVMTDPNDATIARTIITLAKSLGLTVVAEGVETEAQRDFLIRAGCENFQGYLFGRPVAVEDISLASFASSFTATQPTRLMV